MESVLNQTYPNVEYIIVDGDSNDGTLDIIKKETKENSNIHYISEKDKGIYDALNKGVELATGDVIGFVHSDDYLASSTIVETIMNAFAKYNVDGVYGDLHYVSFDKPDAVIRNWKSQSFTPKLLKQGWMPAHPTLFLKREVYLEKGKFDTKFKIAADYDFVLRVFRETKYSFYYLAETITKMRVGGASNKSLKNLIQKTKEDYQACRRNGLKLPYKVVLIKNLSKIPQWITK